MILTDTGPLVALLDADDPYHAECVATLHRLPLGPLLTTWVCFTEAMYSLARLAVIAIKRLSGTYVPQDDLSCISRRQQKLIGWRH